MESEKNFSPSNYFKVFAFIGMALVFSLVFAGLFLPVSQVSSESTTLAGDENDDLRTITAQGNAEISAAPEKVEVYLSIFTDSLKAVDSQNDNAEVSADVITALKAVGIAEDDIETVSYSLSELREWDKFSSKYVRKGFRTTNALKVTSLDTQMAGKIIDAATGAGANKVNSILFGLKDETVKALKLDALKMASADSLKKAKAMASGAGVSIVQLESMAENSAGYYPVYSDYLAESADVAESAPTEVFAGDIKVSASVTATYSIE